MNNFIKKISIAVVCCALLSMASVKAYAFVVAYNTSTSKDLVSIANDTASKQTISANTRPTVGNGGVVINIIKSDGTVKASKVFPYYTSVEDLTANLPSSSVRRIQVKPYSAGQNIQGNVTYYVN